MQGASEGQIITDWDGEIDSTQHAEVEYGGAEATLVNEPGWSVYQRTAVGRERCAPDVSDRRRNQCLQRGHADATDDARGHQGGEALRLGGPETGHHQADGGDEIDGTLAILDRQRVAEQTAKGDGGDGASLYAGHEGIKRHAEFFCQGDKGRSEKGTDGYRALGATTAVDPTVTYLPRSHSPSRRQW